MSNQLNLLIIEDSEDDCILLVRELRRSGFEIDYSRVDNKPELLEALAVNKWDIVITDHNMPRFNSHDALEVIRADYKDLPVIIVSGSIGEEVAVAAMKSGANDYIMKSNLARLVPAIERELREHENRKAHRHAEEQIKHMAYHDALTGLTNRFQFEKKLEKLLHLSRDQDESHAMLYLDLDQFKIINDTCGHIAGDELLRQLAVLLKKHIREGDTLARLGGDEFGVLLENCPFQRVMVIAEELLSEVKEFRFSWKNKSFSLGVSIGLVMISEKHQNINEVLSEADMACYTAKDQGRNRVYVYHINDKQLLRHANEMEWATKINNALEENRLILYKQCIVPLNEEDKTYYCEFLLRMNDEDDQLILPGAFIPAAERFNIMPKIDRWVIDQTFSYLAHHLAAKTDVKQVGFINLSGTSINDPSLFTYIREKLEAYRLDPRCVCFEITETVAIINLKSAVAFIDEIRELGCLFALDDFGSGMSSFSYLNTIPVDFIKIDGEFVREMLSNPMSAAIVESINNIGHVAGIRTIGEYAENDAIISRLRQIGVDFAQGFGLETPQQLSSD